MKRALVHLSLSATVVLLAASCGGSANTNTDMPQSGCTVFGKSCLPTPLAAAVRTPCGQVTEFCDAAANPTPNLTCLGQTGGTPPAGPAKVTLTGFVHPFSSGPNSNDLTVQVFDAAAITGGADPATATPIAQTTVTLDPATQRACDMDAAKGCSLPSATGCALPVCNDGLSGRTDNTKYCRDLGNGMGECSARLRWEARYNIDNVPTNTQLVLRVTGPGGKPDSTWATTVAFNIELSTGDPACKGPLDVYCFDTTNPAAPKYQLNASALSQSDYVKIPTSAGLGGGISVGLGGVAGEVHDCDNVRVGNVQVGVSPAGDRFTYFNGDPIKTLPDSARSDGTDRLGLYASLNVKPGPVEVETGGVSSVGAPMTSFGKFTGIVYPNTVSIITINGGRVQK